MDSDTGAPGRTLAERLVDADKNLNNPCREWGYEDALGTSRLLREAAAALSSPPRADVEALLREAYFEGFYDANGRGDEGVESWRASRVFAALASPAPSAAPVAAEGPTLEAFTKEFLRLTEGRMLAMPGLDHIPGLRQYAQAALRPQEPAPVVAQEPVRGACDALHCAISLAVAAGREDTAEVLRALYAGAAPPTEQPRNELEAYVNDLEAAAHTKEVGS